MGPLFTLIYILLSPLPFYWMTYVKNLIETALHRAQLGILI